MTARLVALSTQIIYYGIDESLFSCCFVSSQSSPPIILNDAIFPLHQQKVFDSKCKLNLYFDQYLLENGHFLFPAQDSSIESVLCLLIPDKIAMDKSLAE